MRGAGLSLEMWKIAEAECVPGHEGSTCVIVTRDDVAPPGSKAGSRMKSSRRNMRGPTGSARLVSGGGWGRGIAGAAIRAEVGSRTGSYVPMTPSKETRRAEGRGQPGRSPREEGPGPDTELGRPAIQPRTGERGGLRGRPNTVHRPAASHRRRGARISTGVPTSEAVGKCGSRGIRWRTTSKVAPGQVWSAAPRGQDAPDRAWQLTGHGSASARRAASGNLCLSRLHPLMRVDPGRQVHRQAQDTEQAPVAQADGAASGSVAADAYAAGRAAPLVLQRAAGPLRLLRHAAQLALAQRVPAGSPAHLVQLPQAAVPEEPAHGLGLV